MSNSIDDFLSKASPEQREKIEAQIKDAASLNPMSESDRIAKRAKETNDIAQRNDPTKGQQQYPTQEPQKTQNSVDNALTKEQQGQFKQVAQNYQIKGENATQVAKPHTPSQTQPRPTGLDNPQLNAQTADRIKGVEQAKGNNYENDNKPQNSVDKISAQAKEAAKEAGQSLQKQGVVSNDKER